MPPGLQVTVSEDFAAFDAAAAEFVAADPVGNTVLLTILAILRGGGHYAGRPWFAWAVDDGRVVGTACRTPPYHVALATMPTEAAEALGAATRARELPGALGRPETVAAFAAAAGLRVHVRMHETQYVLDRQVEPPPVTGSVRPYVDRDMSLYLDWIVAFETEAGLRHHPDPRDALELRLRTGGELWFLELDGTPVCMVGRGPAVCGVPRIGPVWTPPEHRRRGYATALTDHVCRAAFEAGARACTLFADAANGTSNGIYRRIGFVEAATVVEADFGAQVSRG